MSLKPESKPYGWPIKAWEDAEASLLIYNGRIADKPQAAIANIMLAMEPYIQARTEPLFVDIADKLAQSLREVISVSDRKTSIYDKANLVLKEYNERRR